MARHDQALHPVHTQPACLRMAHRIEPHLLFAFTAYGQHQYRAQLRLADRLALAPQSQVGLHVKFDIAGRRMGLDPQRAKTHGLVLVLRPDASQALISRFGQPMQALGALQGVRA